LTLFLKLALAPRIGSVSEIGPGSRMDPDS